MIVITGATGNTGSVAAEKLLANGKKVRVIGRDASKLQRFVSKGAEAFAAKPDDAAALTKAFSGAEAVYALLPMDITSKEYTAWRRRIADAQTAAIRNAGVAHVVALSSVGAQRADLSGPEADLHYLEEKLNAIPGANVLHLRPGFFMENLLPQIGVIKMLGFMAGVFRPELALPQIAARDIGEYAAERLAALDFAGHEARELLGARNVSMAEAARIIGPAIGKPELEYKQVPGWQQEFGMKQLGASDEVAKLVVTLAEEANAGKLDAQEKRSAANTTPTTIEQFVRDAFAPMFQGKSAGA